MIIFLNGPFGIGKTSIAEALHLRLANSMIFDPEEVGFMLGKVLQDAERVTDFQDYPLWRTLTPVVAQHLLQQYGRALIVPMTVWRNEYRDQIFDGLRRADSDLRVYTLMASPAVLETRILSRDFGVAWSMAHLEPSLEALATGETGITIDTSQMSAPEVAAVIAGDIASVTKNHTR
jgi:hypothetical protein